ncbi:MAG: tRNA threonylcarbamoyladenosine biosynthesis protein TsaB [Patescibacteria group bacterium]|nr:tRNA threonylcarbamoyladenosine biosynthesis protein TsaB [Patescibacteria group bacterium]
MHLLVDTVSPVAAFVFFDSDRNVVRIDREAMSGREFERFLARISESCAELGMKPKDLQGIVCVRGPAGFTGIRIVSLTLGTLSFTAGIPLFGIDYAELQLAAGWNGGTLVRANRDEYAFSPSPGAGFSVMRKSDVPDGRYRGIADEFDFEGRGISVKSEVDYAWAVRSFDLSSPSNRIEPFYVKKPHIT